MEQAQQKGAGNWLLQFPSWAEPFLGFCSTFVLEFDWVKFKSAALHVGAAAGEAWCVGEVFIEQLVKSNPILGFWPRVCLVMIMGCWGTFFLRPIFDVSLMSLKLLKPVDPAAG